MRFLFVDRITSVSGSSITGVFTPPVTEPLQYGGPGLRAELAPGVVSEAIGQLASWLCISRNDFMARPVFLFAPAIEVLAPVQPGRPLELFAVLQSVDGESMCFSGHATQDGQVVHRVRDCNGFNMPLAELEDPLVTRRRWQDLTSGGLHLPDRESAIYDFGALTDRWEIAADAQSLVAHKILSPSEPFFADHFPRRPVTPIVMLNEMIGAATVRLASAQGFGRIRPALIEDIKIKSFIVPGDACEIRVTLKPSPNDPKGVIRTISEIIKDGRRVLRGRYLYQAH